MKALFTSTLIALVTLGAAPVQAAGDRYTGILNDAIHKLPKRFRSLACKLMKIRAANSLTATVRAPALPVAARMNSEGSVSVRPSKRRKVQSIKDAMEQIAQPLVIEFVTRHLQIPGLL